MTKAKNAQFNVIPRGFKGCIYVAEMKNGLVKVGFSQNPKTRLRSLSYQVGRVYGTEINRFHICKDAGRREARRAETFALNRLREIGNQFPDTLEFFTGVHFGSAVNLANQMTRANISNKAAA